MVANLELEDVSGLDPRQFVKRLETSGLAENKALKDELELCRKFVGKIDKRRPRELPSHLDAHALEQAGWGVVYTTEDERVVQVHFQDLLALRRKQAGSCYKEVLYTPGMLARQFLWGEHQAAPGTIDPKNLPYYVLLVGGPEKIPFEFQCQLSISHAVGRICFEDPADYGRYARAVFHAETRSVNTPCQTGIFSVDNGDKATRLLTKHLVQPLEKRMARPESDGGLEVWRQERATKRHLSKLLSGQEGTPELLLVSCHGKKFSPMDPELQKARQGALICQDWVYGQGPSTEDEYFHADDVPKDAQLQGLVAFFFACYGAGTPLEDNFPHEAEGSNEEALRPSALTLKPFVARLPQVLLAHGASAVVGHVDRGWTLSFSWPFGQRMGKATLSLEDSLNRFLGGARLGHALRPLYRRYTSLAARLVEMLERLRYGEKVNKAQLALLWTAHNDARNFIILGDPAVCLQGQRVSRRKPLPTKAEPGKGKQTDLTNLSADRGQPSAPKTLRLSDRGEFIHDLEILVLQDRTPRSLTFWLSSPALGLNNKRYGPVDLQCEPQEYFQEFFLKVNRWLRDRSRAQEKLAEQGAHLAELLPKDLMKTLWELREQVKTVRIQSEEAWIPWELLKLQGRDKTGHWQEGPFLCEAFALTRWRNEVASKYYLPLRNIGVVAPKGSNLPAVVEECQSLLSLSGKGRQVHPVPARQEEVLAELSQGELDGWHFTGHGITPPGDPDHWAIVLEGGDELTPASLYGEVRNLGKAHPLIFLNACHTGRGAKSLSNVGGWASKLLDVGAGAFIGASWAVEDQPAKELAEVFYRKFLTGVPIGEAVRQARLEIKSRYPDDPTWLAYAVFAHPLAVCRMAPQQSEDVSSVEISAGVVQEEASISGSELQEARSRGHRPGRSQRSQMWLDKTKRFSWRAVGLLIGLLIVAALHVIPTSTRVQLYLTVDEVALTVGGQDRQMILDTSLRLRALTLAKISQLELDPSELRSNTSADPLAITGQVKLTARDPGAYVSLEPEDHEGESLRSLGPLWAEPGARVVLRTQRAGADAIELGLQLRPTEPLSLPYGEAFRLEADFVDVTGLDVMPFQGSGVFWRVQLRDPVIKIHSGSEGLKLIATIPASSATKLLDQELPVTAVSFLKPGPGDVLLTCLREPGQLSYPDHSWREPVVLQAEDYLVLEELRAFRLRSISLDAPSGHLRLVLDGFASSISAGASGLEKEHGLSLFKRLRGPAWLWLVNWLLACGALARFIEKKWKEPAKES